ncbi:YopX family protein [Glutamicibacter halophytocola]|uniref:YopX family protein n=1 Tax=Glutamicibacter halophytocola TaxID=1933880 RepID=UPI0015C538DE|nr:YopX family protein [Glutamicibacter halophytocola]NQD41438.1 hypothetical protein [Glutamicibacter halophytocola]
MSSIKLRFYCKEHGFVDYGFGTNIEEVHFNQHGELGRWCPICAKSRPMTLVRWTGLKDKNDVEIYEGDIVRASKNWPGTGEQMFVSTFRNNTATFAFREAHVNNDGDKYFYDMLQVRDVEVIGNIYENSDLLEPIARE